jgi:hypothetical protein
MCRTCVFVNKLKCSDKGITFETSRACTVSISSLFGKGLLYILGDKIVVGMYSVYNVCTASFKGNTFVRTLQFVYKHTPFNSILD